MAVILHFVEGEVVYLKQELASISTIVLQTCVSTASTSHRNACFPLTQRSLSVGDDYSWNFKTSRMG